MAVLCNIFSWHVHVVSGYKNANETQLILFSKSLPLILLMILSFRFRRPMWAIRVRRETEQQNTNLHRCAPPPTNLSFLPCYPRWVLSIPQWVWLLGSNRWQRSWRKSFLPMCWQFRSNSSSSFETGRRIHTKIWWMTNRYKFHICTFLPAWCRCSSHGRGNIHPSRNWFPSLYSWKRYCRPRTISYLWRRYPC